MPPQFNTPKTKETPVPVHLTPPSSGSLSSPNLKEICERNDLETPEKTFLIKKRGSRVLQDVQGVVFLTAANHNVRNAHAVPMKRSYSVVGFRLTG